MEQEEQRPWKPVMLVLVFWGLSAANMYFCWCYPASSMLALVSHISSLLICVLLSFLLAVPTIPKSRKPFMQALWYTVLGGMLPAAVAISVLRWREGELPEAILDYFENVALFLMAFTVLALWVGGADTVGTLGLQPLAQAGASSWAPVVYLQSTILWIVVLYNLTHIVGSVDASVQQDLPLSLQIIYFVIVTLWLVSLLRVLCTRPGQPKDFQEGADPLPASNNWLFCIYCQAQKPPRCRHCAKCGSCVLRMDHHCPWLRQCIGFGNYKYFVMFITYSAVALLFKAVTLLLFSIRAFQTDITFLTKLWLVCTETLVMALGGTMVAFAGFHILLSCKGMTTIEFLTRHEKSEKKISYDQGTVGNIQASLGRIPLFWLLPACPPSGDGRIFPYTVIPQEAELKATQSSQDSRSLALAQREKTALIQNAGLSDSKNAAFRAPSQPCLPSTAEPTCLEQQQDGCVAADNLGEDDQPVPGPA